MELDVSAIANCLAVFGILSWISGDRSLFFGPIALRIGMIWKCARWFGLVIWIVGINGKELWFLEEGWLAFFGAFCLFVGSAKKRVTQNFTEQGAASDR